MVFAIAQFSASPLMVPWHWNTDSSIAPYLLVPQHVAEQGTALVGTKQRMLPATGRCVILLPV